MAHASIGFRAFFAARAAQNIFISGEGSLAAPENLGGATIRHGVASTDQSLPVSIASSTYVNFPIADTFQTANPNIATVLANIKCAGSTSSAEGRWTGYQQLIGLNQPRANNVILFITDGQPTGVTFDMPVANSSLCRQYTPGSPAGAGTYIMPPAGKGDIRGVYNTYTNFNHWFGPLKQNGIAGSDGLQLVANQDFEPAPNSSGCAYYTSWPANVMNTTDFLGVPTKDIYGNSANTSYQPVTLNSDGFIDITNHNNAPAAALNAADSAATNIRSGAVDPVSGRSLSYVVIYSIGLDNLPLANGRSQLGATFLERVSNDPSSPIFNRTKPAGRYIRAASSAELSSAFGVVASDMLRTR